MHGTMNIYLKKKSMKLVRTNRAMRVIWFCAHFSTLVSISFFKSTDELKKFKGTLKVASQMTDYPECPSEASLYEEECCQEGQAYSRDYISIWLEMAPGWTHLWMPVVYPKGKCQKEAWYLDWSIWHLVVLHPWMFVCPTIKYSHVSITDAVTLHIAVWCTGTLYRDGWRFGSLPYLSFLVRVKLVSIQESWIRSRPMSRILNINVIAICDSIITNWLNKYGFAAKSFLKNNTLSVVKKFPALCGIRKVVTALKRVRQW